VVSGEDVTDTSSHAHKKKNLRSGKEIIVPRHDTGTVGEIIGYGAASPEGEKLLQQPTITDDNDHLEKQKKIENDTDRGPGGKRWEKAQTGLSRAKQAV